MRANDGRAKFAAAYHVPTNNPGVEEMLVADLDRDDRLELLTPIPDSTTPRPQPARCFLFKLQPVPRTGPWPGSSVGVIPLAPLLLPSVSASQARSSSQQPSALPEPSARPEPTDLVTDSAALRRETQTRQSGIAQRQPGEADTTFLRRVLPVSFPASDDLLAYTWRPSSFGKQLFFTVSGPDGNEYGRELFVLDPFRANTYAVQVFNLESMGDATTVAALFFADVDQNGQRELLALLACNLREPAFKDKYGTQYYGRETSYETHVFRYSGLDSAGRPQYREDSTPRPYLHGLSTAAAVRQALAQQQ